MNEKKKDPTEGKPETSLVPKWMPLKLSIWCSTIIESPMRVRSFTRVLGFTLVTFFIVILGVECFSPGKFPWVRAALFVPISLAGVLTLYGLVGSIKFKSNRDFSFCAIATYLGFLCITPMRKDGLAGLLDELFGITVVALGFFLWSRIPRKKEF
jgi:hypothetical protein